MRLSFELINEHCFIWLNQREENSIDAIVTDPPYGVKEYTPEEIEKKRQGSGGIWRIPSSMGGAKRQAVPRFSVINDDPKLRKEVYDFFFEWGKLALKTLKPGGHLIIASTPLLSDIMSQALRDSGFERRGEIVRVVKTIRGGDRPKNHELEFPKTSVIPRGHWEPWGVFRKPVSEKTIAQNLRKWGTGALRRPDIDIPFSDLIISEKTTKKERSFNNHPSIKPQSFMRQVVRAALPLGKGIVLDPFVGSGSTIAAAEYLGYDSIGIELDKEFYDKAKESIPKLSRLEVVINGDKLV